MITVFQGLPLSLSVIQGDGRGSGEILAVDQCQNTQCGKLSVGVVALTDKYYL